MNIIEFFKAVLFGIVEGITEWLPISSTGHLIILEDLVQLDMSDAFKSMFNVVIQLGAILAVILLFWHKIWPFGKKENKVYVKTDIFMMWVKIVVASIPAALMIPFQDKCEELFHNPVGVSIALIVFGVLFIIIENHHKNVTPKVTKLADITFQAAFVIGIWQLIAAAFPGTSRSGATIIGALLLGLSRKTAAEFTFFLAIPAMVGVSFLKIIKFGFNFTSAEIGILLTGTIVSFLVSVFVIRFLMGYIKKHDFKVFGWYRIVLGIIVLASGLIKALI